MIASALSVPELRIATSAFVVWRIKSAIKLPIAVSVVRTEANLASRATFERPITLSIRWLKISSYCATIVASVGSSGKVETIECFNTSIKKAPCFNAQEPITSVVSGREATLCGGSGIVDKRISEIKRKSEPLLIEGTMSIEWLVAVDVDVVVDDEDEDDDDDDDDDDVC